MTAPTQRPIAARRALFGKVVSIGASLFAWTREFEQAEAEGLRAPRAAKAGMGLRYLRRQQSRDQIPGVSPRRRRT